MKKQIHWVNAFYLIATPLVASIFVPLYLIQYGTPPLGILAFAVIYGILTSLCITAGYHRYFSHRSYKAKRGLEIFFILVGAASFQGPLLQWVKDHRRHHRRVDTEDDPYNINQGFFFAHMGWLFYKEDPKYSGNDPKDLTADPLILWQSKHYVWIAIAMGFLLPIIVGLLLGSAYAGFLFAAVGRLVVTNHTTFFINSWAHTWGSRPYSTQQTARDSAFLAFFSYGEGYHNFHHVFETDYRNGIRWYHWDPTKWLILSASWVGITRNLRVTSPSDILEARLSTDEGKLLQRGFSAEMVESLRVRVVDAQLRWRKIKEDYRSLKKSMESGSRDRLSWLRREARNARLDFKRAQMLWGSYLRRPKPQLVRSSSR